MPEPRRYIIPTPYGQVALVFAPVMVDALTVFIHGAARRSVQLRRWLRPGTALLELPGHGVAPMIDGGVKTWAKAFQHAISTVWPAVRLTLVGESLGGIIAMHMTAERIIALDPPMQPTEAVEREIEHGNVADFLRPMIRADYWSLLDAQERPVEVICAERGILPADARERLSRNEKVALSTAPCGHLILDEAPEVVEAALARQQDNDDAAVAASAAVAAAGAA